MARLSTVLMLCGLLSTSLVAAQRKPFNQEEQNRNADCDNDCFFGSFAPGSCTNDAACMCTQQKYRERYFCCMAKNCAPSVMPDSIQRQSLGCEGRGMEFTFDPEKVCGIKLTTTTSSSAISATATPSATGDDSTSASETSTAPTATASPSDTATESSSTGTASPSSTGSVTPSPGSAPKARVMLKGVAIIAAVSGMLLW